MNRKGFTLVELLGTIIILALVMSIAGFSITNILNSSKEENYQLLVRSIVDGAELYYQECKYDKTSTINTGKFCTTDGNGYRISLGNLVTYGYMTANGKMSDADANKDRLFRPDNTDDPIDDCEIKVYFNTNTKKTVVESLSSAAICPTSKEYGGDFSK